MIAWLKGEILEKKAPTLVLNVNCVGYEIFAPMTTFYELPEAGEVALHIHFVVREDAQQLYGFLSKDEKRLFQTLVKVNGVGPKLALTILSNMQSQEFVACVQHDDVTSLVKIPGIGKKTAERLLVEMRDRLKDWFAGGDASLQPTAKSAGNALNNEAASALEALGYKSAEAVKMVKAAAASSDATTVEQLIRQALRNQGAK